MKRFAAVFLFCGLVVWLVAVFMMHRLGSDLLAGALAPAQVREVADFPILLWLSGIVMLGGGMLLSLPDGQGECPA